MRPLAAAAIRAGIIPEETLREFRHWGVVPDEADLKPYDSIDEAVEGIQEALESEEQVRLQTTDLDALRRFLDQRIQRRGRLVLVDTDTGEHATKSVVFSVMRGYLATHEWRVTIPWIADSISDIMTNGSTYLAFKEGERNVRIYFSDVVELYFGSTKAFMVCTGKEHESDGRDNS